MEEQMDERFDVFFGKLCDIKDDMDSLHFLLDELERYYEYTCNKRCRQLVKGIANSIEHIAECIECIVRQEVYQQQESTEES